MGGYNIQISLISLREKCPYSEFFCLYFSAFGQNTGKHVLEKLRIQTLHESMRTVLFLCSREVAEIQ